MFGLVVVVVLVNILLLGKGKQSETEIVRVSPEETKLTQTPEISAQAADALPFATVDPAIVDRMQVAVPDGVSLFGLVPYTDLDISALRAMFPNFSPLENNPQQAFVDSTYTGTVTGVGRPPFTPFDRIVYVYSSGQFSDLELTNESLYSTFRSYLDARESSVLSARNRGAVTTTRVGFSGELVQYHIAESCGWSECFFDAIRACQPTDMVTTYDHLSPQYVRVDGSSPDGRCKVTIAQLGATPSVPASLGSSHMSCVVPRGTGYVQMLQTLYVNDLLNPEYECTGPFATQVGTYSPSPDPLDDIKKVLVSPK